MLFGDFQVLKSGTAALGYIFVAFLTKNLQKQNNLYLKDPGMLYNAVTLFALIKITSPQQAKRLRLI